MNRIICRNIMYIGNQNLNVWTTTVFFFITRQLRNIMYNKCLDSGHHKPMKRSKVRVTIEVQHVLLQIALQIKMFDFLLNIQNHRMHHIFLGILLNL